MKVLLYVVLMCSVVFGCRYFPSSPQYKDILNQKAPIPYAIYKNSMPTSFCISELKDEIKYIWEWHMHYFYEHNVKLFYKQERNMADMFVVPEVSFSNVSSRVYLVSKVRNSLKKSISAGLNEENLPNCFFEQMPEWELSRVLDFLMTSYGLRWRLQNNEMLVWRD